jgi:hypothetical protein
MNCRTWQVWCFCRDVIGDRNLQLVCQVEQFL